MKCAVCTNIPECPKCGNDDCYLVATVRWSRKTGSTHQYNCLKLGCGYSSPDFQTEEGLLEYIKALDK